MSGPWYEEQSPTIEYVTKDILSLLNDLILKFPEESPQTLTDVIGIEIHNEYKKYNNFGSYRGYSIFTRHSIKKRITIHLKKRRRAMIWLRQSNKFNNWMNHVLYRPPEKNKKILRYVSVKKSFHNKL